MQDFFTGTLIPEDSPQELFEKGKYHEDCFQEYHQKQDAEKALEYYSLARQRGYTSAILKSVTMEKMVQKCNEIQTACDHFNDGRKLSVQEIYLIGTNYLDGVLTSKDNKQGMLWIWDAALNGHVQAQYQIGSYYLRYIRKNKEIIKEGLRFVKMAAENGFTEAQVEMGDIYRRGVIVPMDYQEARKWYSLAVKNGSSAAELHMRRLNR